jgi:hypothetical protein
MQASSNDRGQVANQKGTILNAVPPAKDVPMSPLDQEITNWMAKSTSGDIIAALENSHIATKQLNKHTRKSGSDSLLPRTWGAKQQDTDARVGLWVKGVAHWDENSSARSQGKPSFNPPATDIGPFRLMPPIQLKKGAKPLLTVVIPHTEGPVAQQCAVMETSERSISLISAIAPAGVGKQDEPITPHFAAEHVVSPLGSGSVRRITPVSLMDGRIALYQQHRLVARERSLSSLDSLAEPDDRSACSNKSSATSIDSTMGRNENQARPNPVRTLNVNKPLPTLPTPPPPRRTAPSSPAPGQWLPQHRRAATWITFSQPSTKNAAHARARSSLQLESLDRAFVSTAPCRTIITRPASPTLSEAEHDLEAHLSAIERSSVYSQQSFLVPHSLDRKPSVPKRSRKRDWLTPRHTAHCDSGSPIRAPGRRRSSDGLSPQIQGATFNRLSRNASASSAPLSSVCSYSECVSTPWDAELSQATTSIVDDELVVERRPSVASSQSSRADSVSSDSAERVLLSILSALHSLDDLCNTALINKGMYRVFKNNELHLLCTVLRNQSPAAWELRRWSQPLLTASLEPGDSSDPLEYTAQSYLYCHQLDMAVVGSLKRRILKQCSQLVRPETTSALTSASSSDVQKIDDALWRIWSFCIIFGTDKGREDDVTGQLDWLKGGILAHNQDLTATMNVNLDLEMISVLLNPPEFFAEGNSGGLSAPQLYDMVEIWNCLCTMLQGYHGRTEQARHYGIFDGLDTSEPDAADELLEEWTAYLMTLGPAVILKMAELAQDPEPSGFALAKTNGWTEWSLSQQGTSRTTFLKEPVSRLYQERVSVASAKLQQPQDQELKEKSRKRVANLAAEIKLARKASGYKRLPVIDMSQERPMSAVSRCTSVIDTIPAHSRHAVTPTRRATANLALRRFDPSITEPKTLRPVLEQPQAIELTAVEDADRALTRLMDMGWPAPAARKALQVTNTGESFHVERAVEVLLGIQ